jgi:glycosyltransferase involved in cell wall biosynthesis
LLKAPFSDAIIIQRKLFGQVFLHLLSILCKKIIFDFDDAIFSKSDGSQAPRRMQRFKKTIGCCWQVWAGNQYLLNIAQQQVSEHRGKNTYIKYVPTVIKIDRCYRRGKEPPFRMLWIGSQSTSKYFYQNTVILEALGEKFHNLKLIVVSDFKFDLENLAVECHAWSESVELEQAANAHVGIAPMSDDDWSRGKCALKLLQHMAAGLPVISSNTGANAEVVINGETGFVADTINEWLEAIDVLQRQPKAARKMGVAGLKHVQEQFNSETWVAQQLKWLSIKES